LAKRALRVEVLGSRRGDLLGASVIPLGRIAALRYDGGAV
jgi:hypothetical protein